MSDDDYSSIGAISISFLQHSSHDYRAAHCKLDTQYGEMIYGIKDLLNAKTNVPNLVVDKFLQSMLGTDSPDEQRFRTYIQKSAITLKWKTYEPANQARLTNLEQVLKDAVRNKKVCLQLVVNINGLHFKPNFAANDLNHISDTEFEQSPATPPNRLPASTPHATPDQFSQAFSLALQNLVSPQASNTGAGTPLSQSGGAQTQLTGNIINPSSLPTDVRTRYERCIQHDVLLTKHDRAAYTITDNTGALRSALYYMDGPNRLISRSGDVYYFSKWDEKQQKTFISRCPKPASKSHDPITIREWYCQFHAHAKAYGIYVHNYYDFRKLPGDPKGFTCGDTTHSDVPLLLESKLRLWSSTIHAALQDIFSSPSTPQYNIVHRQHGHGYESLFDIIRSHHPEHTLYPSLLIKDRPSQKDKQTIPAFYTEYMNYLTLRAHLTNTATTLNNLGERELFIGSLRRGTEILSTTYDERNSTDPDKQAMYSQGNLVSALESAYKRLRPVSVASSAASSLIPRLPLERHKSRSRSTPSSFTAKPKRINAIVFDDRNPFDVQVPNGMEHLTGLRDCYVHALSSGHSTTFDTTRPCLACGKPGHTFDDCPVLKNIDFLRRHFIAFQSFQKRNSADKAAVDTTVTATVSQLTADDESFDDDIPDPEDFHQGRE